ncbi:hypothetical protein Mtc_0574 [Methanocella conradii HZ254]|uniref:HTH arsR-type domain-containing protein n=1 Tax=Methanocella conradii (strain DSM 24694 / JCM 17849 / CGMCC 1.5162 / HZ254) TaxID=1041930 RepID=H8I5M0_METCZ|nr:winged helix-turn-helix domain-containing protein [Methanocella conradii]AFC99339.1 hypothetical protein Mtc_0574 [Methanocella conradii HZ254]MDI6896880.1 winged helix-turn-helix domain-containing protein [Methanocella conradii]
MRKDRIEERLAALEKGFREVRAEQRQAIESLRDELRSFQEAILEDRIASINEVIKWYEEAAYDGAISGAARNFQDRMRTDCPPQYKRQECIDGLVDELKDDATRLRHAGDLKACIEGILEEDERELEKFKGMACERCLDAYVAERDELIGLAQKLAGLKADLASRGRLVYMGEMQDGPVISSVIEPLSHEARFRMLKRLAEGSLSFKELAGVSGFEGGHLNYHLVKLSQAGLIAKAEDGRYVLTDKGSGVMSLVKRLYEA